MVKYLDSSQKRPGVTTCHIRMDPDLDNSDSSATSRACGRGAGGVATSAAAAGTLGPVSTGTCGGGGHAHRSLPLPCLFHSRCRRFDIAGPAYTIAGFALCRSVERQ